jgi:hypothetical protein
MVEKHLLARAGGRALFFSVLLLFGSWPGIGRGPDGLQLGISSGPPGQIQLAWPAGTRGVLLEETPSLVFPTWQTVRQPPRIQDGRMIVSSTPGGNIRFYRLRQIEGSVFKVLEHAPLDGAIEVGATFRPQIAFSRPVNPDTLSEDSELSLSHRNR